MAGEGRRFSKILIVLCGSFPSFKYNKSHNVIIRVVARRAGNSTTSPTSATGKKAGEKKDEEENDLWPMDDQVIDLFHNLYLATRCVSACRRSLRIFERFKKILLPMRG